MNFSIIDLLIFFGIGKFITRYCFKTQSKNILIGIVIYSVVMKVVVYKEYGGQSRIIFMSNKFGFLNKEERRRTQWLYNNFGVFYPIFHPYIQYKLEDRRKIFVKEQKIKSLENRKEVINRVVELCIKNKNKCISSSISLSNGYVMAIMPDELEKRGLYKVGIINLIESNQLKDIEKNCRNIDMTSMNLYRYYKWSKVNGSYHKYLSTYLNINIEKDFFTKCFDVKSEEKWQSLYKQFSDHPVANNILQKIKQVSWK